MEKQKGIKLTWAKPVKVNLKLFTGLFKLVKDVATGDAASIPKDFKEVISGVQLLEGNEQRGWLLVTRSLADAMMRLVDEHKYRINVDAVVSDQLEKQLNDILQNEEYYLGFDFFESPKTIKLLDAVQPVFCDFLQNVGFDPAMADNICHRLSSYFVLALMDEWRKNPTYYRPLKKGIKTPFDSAGQKEMEWHHYLAWLKKQVDEPVFSESFSLKQIYIPLRAYYKLKVKQKGETNGQDFKEHEGKTEYKKVATYLEEELSQWLETADKDDALRVVTGGPGYGKSSFLKIFAAQLAGQNKRVLFVPLHRFEIKDDLRTAIQDFIYFNDYLSHDPLGQERLLIIFDGLDELAMLGRALADAANHFIREIKMKLTNFNSNQIRVQVLMSGRDIIIQANDQEFRKDKQILHILPYYITIGRFVDKKGILKKDQRDNWWQNYGRIKGKEYKGLPEKLRNEDLDQLTAQPLLNYLVALSFERGKIDFSEKTNLNEIYKDLLEAVYVRSYEENRVHKTVEKMEYPIFIRFLEEIAVAAWHGDGRTTTVIQVEKYCGDLIKRLDTLKTGAKEGMVSFMAAFYFHKAGRDTSGEETFEFTHKSFGEFLAARRIVSKLRQINKKLLETDIDERWNIKKCLTEWAKIFGPKMLDEDLLKFISNETKVIQEEDKDELLALQKTVTKMMNYMLRSGMPMEDLGGTRASYFIENRYAINSEKALLIMLSTIADLTDKISKINWPNKTAFGELLSRLQGQRTGADDFTLQFLNHLDLKHSFLNIKDFYGANLRRSKLNFSNLYRTTLRHAYLMEADLTGANLYGADLTDAILKGNDFKGADLREAVLVGTDLREAVLVGTDLREAVLVGTDLREADLTNANLRGADLREADLMEVDLSGAILAYAKLMGVDLRESGVTKEQMKYALTDKQTKLPWSNRKK